MDAISYALGVNISVADAITSMSSLQNELTKTTKIYKEMQKATKDSLATQIDKAIQQPKAIQETQNQVIKTNVIWTKTKKIMASLWEDTTNWWGKLSKGAENYCSKIMNVSEETGELYTWIKKLLSPFKLLLTSMAKLTTGLISLSSGNILAGIKDLWSFLVGVATTLVPPLEEIFRYIKMQDVLAETQYRVIGSIKKTIQITNILRKTANLSTDEALAHTKAIISQGIALGKTGKDFKNIIKDVAKFSKTTGTSEQSVYSFVKSMTAIYGSTIKARKSLALAAGAVKAFGLSSSETTQMLESIAKQTGAVQFYTNTEGAKKYEKTLHGILGLVKETGLSINAGLRFSESLITNMDKYKKIGGLKHDMDMSQKMDGVFRSMLEKAKAIRGKGYVIGQVLPKGFGLDTDEFIFANKILVKYHGNIDKIMKKKDEISKKAQAEADINKQWASRTTTLTMQLKNMSIKLATAFTPLFAKFSDFLLGTDKGGVKTIGWIQKLTPYISKLADLFGEWSKKFGDKFIKILDHIFEEVLTPKNLEDITETVFELAKMLPEIILEFGKAIKNNPEAIEFLKNLPEILMSFAKWMGKEGISLIISFADKLGWVAKNIKWIGMAFVALMGIKVAVWVVTAVSFLTSIGGAATAASAGVGGLTVALGALKALGKIALVLAVGVATYAATTELLKWTGLDKVLHDIGGWIADKLGYSAPTYLAAAADTPQDLERSRKKFEKLDLATQKKRINQLQSKIEAWKYNPRMKVSLESARTRVSQLETLILEATTAETKAKTKKFLAKLDSKTETKTEKIKKPELASISSKKEDKTDKLIEITEKNNEATEESIKLSNQLNKDNIFLLESMNKILSLYLPRIANKDRSLSGSAHRWV